jgi:two-component system chemotaxis response regulator CheY
MDRARQLAFLIVDDAATLRRGVRELLGQMGCDQVEEADGGPCALRMLRQRRFDLVLADLHMPGMDGFELLQAIKADVALGHLPVLVMGSEPRKDDLLRTACAGAAGFIVKPFDRSTLALKVGRILQRVALPA